MPLLAFISDGGGIGGILYTLRNGQLQLNHYNARGDVVATSDGSGNQTWRGQYDGFGEVDWEVGTRNTRQLSNTKDQDVPSLVNEGFRYRDLETGAFLTRDPLGFVDGPNVYTYVVQNPWTRFDPLGLRVEDNENTKKSKELQDTGRGVDKFKSMFYGLLGLVQEIPSEMAYTFRSAKSEMAQVRAEISHKTKTGEYTGFQAGVARTAQFFGSIGFSITGMAIDPVQGIKDGASSVAMLPVNLYDSGVRFAAEPSLNNAFDFAENSIAAVSLAAGVRSGLAKPNTASSSSMTTVTSWAEAGIRPDLNPGRWVQLGEATRTNFWKTGLPGPKLQLNPLKLERSEVPFSNSVTGQVPASSIRWPSGWEKWKGILGQRQIMGGGQ